MQFLLNIELIKKHNNKLNDNVTKKKEVWKTIARELIKKGFNLGEKDKAGDKVSNKWNNMLKQYKEFIKETEKNWIWGRSLGQQAQIF